ncbi:hypothetical protein Q73A0000_11220 [Kaistella flava (ex Peng et al. 2021)]|uniref:Uncharacterized protein n=1 Tax=Kaistella flava (ex Peng et al. 2021) TaxID=2038776 RepID=A0A7M2Y9W2_9FLAO|nr:hypothetical protein [Kaistella flava (ex Peng et al. 2021)]QOW10886.1 hypothetical protein Q73A0000_11220 [Kaistella flava (ex Peng et al. 2021)]
MEKNILLINKSGLNQAFIKGFKDEGFSVISFFDDSFHPYTKSLFTKYTNIIRRLFLKDKEYIQRLEKADYQKKLLKRTQVVANMYRFDYALFFRADLYPEKIVSEIREISDIMISYQYDGMKVCRNILNYTTYFDRIFVFDPDDYKNYKHIGFLPLTNCWFSDNSIARPNERDFFYVGVGIDERKKNIRNFQKHLSGRFSLKAWLSIPSFRNEEEFGEIKYSHSVMSYEENMQFTKSSKAIIDFKLPYHNGLSFRFFEAIFYEKKVLTNNSSVRKYDFYHPYNIFVTDFDDLAGIEEFMNLPYQKLSENIVQKYSFSNWIKYVLDEKCFEKINLPECN